MTNLANLVIKLAKICLSGDMVCILDKFKVELVEVCLDVNTLKLRVDILVDQHEVTVDFKSTVLTQDDPNAIVLAVRTGFSFGNCAVFE